ncbi:MAG: TonB family protein [Thermodesulfobacteriota bacterium]
MRKSSKRDRRTTSFLVAILIVLLGVLSWIFFFTHTFQPLWKTLTSESKRILGWEKHKISPEEKRIREEVILKKMEEANADRDWRSLAPEYPRPKKLEPLTGEERMKVLKNSSEFKETEKELKEYLKKREDLLNPEPPIPSLRDVTDFTRVRDKGTEKVIEGLLSKSEKTPQEKPLEENLMLGMKGPLTTRKILERPSLPPVRVKVEAEIELTVYVLPNGLVDRVIPSIKGDAELERIAIQYLKQWRFAPLLKDQPQKEQWGVIPIKFRLQ